jgi:hypothetical protein
MIRYLDFAVAIEADGAGGWLARITSPAGEGRAELRLPYGAAELAAVPGRLQSAVRGGEPPGAGASRDLAPPCPAGPPRDPRTVGEELLQALLSGQAAALYHHSRGICHLAGRALRLRLHLDLARPGLAPLSRLPWELIGPATGEPWSLDFQTPVVRYLEVDRPALPAVLGGPLRLLVAISSPQGYAALDLAGERARIAAGWGAQPGVEIDFLAGATLERLCDALHARPRHVLHFMGHGGFDAARGAGALVLEDARGKPHLVSGESLAAHLRLPQPPFLAVLNACDTARQVAGDGSDPFAGVAAALVRSGLSAVVAMQFPISDAAALAFCRGLYRRLAAGSPLEEAVTAGRLAILDDLPGSLEWVTPVLFLRTEHPTDTPFVVPRAVAENVLDSSEYVAEKTAGFVGRRFVFTAIDSFVARQSRGYFFVRGDPGIGKTALMAELVRRHGYVHHFNILTRRINSPSAFLRNVCARLIAEHRLDHAYLPPEASLDSGFLMALLGTIARRGDAARKTILLVDALDEAERPRPGAGNTLHLPESLPPGVYIVATTRREGETNLPLRIDCEQETLSLDHADPANLADVEAFVANHLQHPGVRRYLAATRLDDAAFVSRMVAKSEGNFMYLHYVLPAVARGEYSGQGAAALPQGLTAYYEQHWQRLRSADEDFWVAYRLPIIMALTVLRQPVPFDLIAKLSGIAQLARVQLALDDWCPFLHAERVVENGGEELRYRLYHLSFLDFVTQKREVGVSLRQAHRRVMEALAEYL